MATSLNFHDVLVGASLQKSSKLFMFNVLLLLLKEVTPRCAAQQKVELCVTVALVNQAHHHPHKGAAVQKTQR